jgi:hypothetical protein
MSITPHPYPLYDELLRQVESRAQTNQGVDVKRLCLSINNICQTLPAEATHTHYREIAALILYHSILHPKSVVTSNIPFDGKLMVGGKGILYGINNLPPTLQQIIGQYVEGSY